MKKNISLIKKATAIGLAVTLTISTVAYCIINNTENASADDTKETTKKLEETISNSISFSSEGVDKEETVYVIADPNGNVTKTIVSDWLKNKKGEDKITDKSNLSDIKNVKDDKEYNKGNNNEIVWDAAGSDIYYQGTTDKTLPVDVKVTYYLDNKETKPADLVGKSGKIKIKFNYINNTKQEVTINNNKVSMYVPFTMISGLMLPSDKFTNIQVDNGKVINDGNNSIVVGIGFSGLNEDLNLSNIAAGLSLPDSCTVTADVTDFSLLMTLTMGICDLLSNVDTANVNGIDDLQKVVDKLVSATNSLQEGGAKLNDGMKTLQSKFSLYAGGINDLSSGIYSIEDGARQINEKAAEFVNGLKTLNDGTNQIVAGLSGDDGAVKGSQALAQGAAQVNSGLGDLAQKVGDVNNQQTIVGGVNALSQGANSIAAGIGSQSDMDNQKENTVSGGVSKINSGVSQLSEGAGKVSAQVGSSDLEKVKEDAAKESPATLAGGILAAATGASNLDKGFDLLITGLNDKVDKNGNITEPGLLTGLNSMVSNVGNKDTALKDAMSEKPSTLLGGAIAVDAGVGQLQGGVSNMVKGINQSINDNNTSIKQLTGVLEQISKTGVDPLTGKAALNENIEKYKTQIVGLTGANQALNEVISQMNDANLDENIGKIKSGTESLKNGVEQLSVGAGELASGATEAVNGIKELKNGSQKLAAGLGTINVNTGKLAEGMETISSNLFTLYQGTNALNNKLPQLINGAWSLYEGTNTLNGNMPALTNGVAALKSGSEQLASGTQKLSDGITTLYNSVTESMQPGVNKLYDGSVLLSTSLNTLYNGTKTAKDGAGKISAATTELGNGIGELSAGALQLSDGIKQFKAEGTDKIEKSFNGEIKDAANRISKTVDVSKQYNIYSEVADNKTSSVKFIYRTEQIGE